MDSDTQDRGDGAPTEHGSTALDIDVHKLGVWMVALGGAAMTIGLVADAIRHANDPDALGARRHLRPRGLPARVVLRWHRRRDPRVARDAERQALQAGPARHRRPAARAGRDPARRIGVDRRLRGPRVELRARQSARRKGQRRTPTPTPRRRPPTATRIPTLFDASTTDATGSAGHTHTDTAAVAPTPYDPTKPIDLSGVPGVTPEEQARAENLIAITLIRLPQWADYHTAEAAGYKSIGDALTGDEHFINIATFSDGRILDPDHPESLVYEPNLKTGEKKLVAAMYMLDPDKTLNDVPDVGGALTQWHIHNNLCFTTGGQVGGLTQTGGSCRLPLVKGSQAPMLHVWITPHPCGPFAALEGIGAGQIKPGETRLCDHAHGA